MLPVDEIEYHPEGLSEQEMDGKSNKDGYITTYCLPINFYIKKEGKWIGDLLVYFSVIGFGIDKFESIINTHYHLPAFRSSVDDEEYFNDVQAFLFIFSNFGKEIQDIIDEALEVLYEYYEEGIKKTLFSSRLFSK